MQKQEQLVVSKDFTLEDVLNVKKYYSLRNKQIPFEEQVSEARAAHKRFEEYMAKRGVVKEGNVYRKKEE
jgi:hypothetical protein